MTSLRTSLALRLDHRVSMGMLCLSICALNAVLLFGQRDNIRIGWEDFRSFYSESILYRSHPGPEMFNYALQADVQNQLFPEVSTPHVALAYDHPPFELVVFLPFSYLSYVLAFYMWASFTTLLAVVAGILLGRGLPRLTSYWKSFAPGLIVASYPFLMLIRQGQDTALALIVMVAAWTNLRRNSDSVAGFWLGLGLFKFQVFIPFALLLACWRPKILKGFASSAALLGIVSVAMIGFPGVRSYVSLLTAMAGDPPHRPARSMRWTHVRCPTFGVLCMES